MGAIHTRAVMQQPDGYLCAEPYGLPSAFQHPHDRYGSWLQCSYSWGYVPGIYMGRDGV